MRHSALRRTAALLAVVATSALLLDTSSPARAADVWTPLGPSGGSVATLAVDPTDGDTVYAGTLEAGVYRSANGGRSWRPAGLDGGVFQLAVAPGTRAVYAVAGGTFFRSRDGGISWTSLSPGLLAAGVSPAVLSFSLSPAPDIVFAVAPPASGGDAEVFRSSDGGDSWRVAWRAPALTFPFRVLADPTDPRYVFALSQRGVHVSADGGATWSATTLPRQVIGLAVEYGPRHRVLALLLNGVSGIRTTEIAVSSDRGQTWRSRGGPVDAANLRADPTTPGGFVAVGATDLYRTTDAGQHWASVGKLPSSSALSLALDPVRPGVAFVAVPGGSLGSTVWKTATYGAVWAPFFRGIFAGDFRTVIADPAAPATLWASADSLSGSPYGLWKSTDRGATWAPGGFNEAFVPYLAFGGGHRLFAGVLGQGLKRSADGGQHWIQVALPFDNLRAVVTPTGEPNTVYVLAATQDGDTISAQLEVSLDAGVTWTTRKLPASLLEVSPGSPATLYANRRAETIVDPAGTDSVQRSTDRGATWTTILEAPGGLVTSIGLDPVNPQRVVVAYRRLAAPRTESIVQWTADGGATWHVLPPQPFAIGRILPDPLVPHGFLAGTGVGVFASADGGATWTRLGVGLPRISTELSLDPASPRSLYAATEGGGIYRLERTVP